MLPLYPTPGIPHTHRFTLWSRRLDRPGRLAVWRLEYVHREARCWEYAAGLVIGDAGVEVVVLPPDERPVLGEPEEN